MDYRSLTKSLSALTDGVKNRISNLANASALLMQSLKDINWAGFYLLEEDVLQLGPFQGKPACISIPMGKGVCGTAAIRDEVLVVPDVHSFEGHIACDPDSASEIVVPLHKNGEVIGLLDIDSPVKNRFSNEDKLGLWMFAKALEAVI